MKEYKQEQVTQVNPPKFDMCEDMSSLTYLNDASVLWNLKIRYVEKLIYVRHKLTPTGLFSLKRTHKLMKKKVTFMWCSTMTYMFSLEAADFVVRCASAKSPVGLGVVFMAKMRGEE